ncbi:PREDICTED: podocalyxin-like protein 2, partial [Galeopterus variegatus]|uniref:Podocalyxin-like protein 2 n=1 Tax=Galeopterus variegatus TaxID=482537 RepID=A0ABM0Q3D7_GALVR
YGFPDLTEKARPMEDTSQAQELPSLPSPLPKMNLVEPPWHVPPEGEEDQEEEEEQEEERETEEEEEEEQQEEQEEEQEQEQLQLLPMNRSQEEAKSQARDFSPTSSSQTSGATKHGHEDSGDQASSGVEVESSLEPSVSASSVTSSAVTPGDQALTSQEAGGMVLPAAGLGVEAEAPQEKSEEAPVGTAGLAGKQGEVPSLASFPQTEAPSRARAPDEDRLYPRTSASFPLAPQDMELTPSSAILGQEDLSQQPLDGQAAETQSRIPWDSTQVICKDWSNLAGKNYVILNMTENIDCEVFRQHRGLQLLALVEEVLPRHGSGHHGDWHISLSKPSEKEQHLLMTLVGEQGVVPTQDVLSMLGDIRRSLEEVREQGLGQLAVLCSLPSPFLKALGTAWPGPRTGGCPHSEGQRSKRQTHALGVSSSQDFLRHSSMGRTEQRLLHQLCSICNVQGQEELRGCGGCDRRVTGQGLGSEGEVGVFSEDSGRNTMWNLVEGDSMLRQEPLARHPHSHGSLPALVQPGACCGGPWGS